MEMCIKGDVCQVFRVAMKRIENLTNRIKRAYRELACTTPLDKITVALLCRHLGISRKAFYTRFESREAILDAILFDDIVEPVKTLYPALTRSVSEQMSARIVNEQVYQSIAEQADFYIHLVSLNEESVVNNAFQKCFQKAQDYSRFIGGVEHTDEYEYASRFLAASNTAMVMYWLRNSMKTPIPVIAEWYDSWSKAAVLAIARK